MAHKVTHGTRNEQIDVMPIDGLYVHHVCWLKKA